MAWTRSLSSITFIRSSVMLENGANQESRSPCARVATRSIVWLIVCTLEVTWSTIFLIPCFRSTLRQWQRSATYFGALHAAHGLELFRSSLARFHQSERARFLRHELLSKVRRVWLDCERVTPIRSLYEQGHGPHNQGGNCMPVEICRLKNEPNNCVNDYDYKSRRMTGEVADRRCPLSQCGTLQFVLSNSVRTLSALASAPLTVVAIERGRQRTNPRCRRSEKEKPSTGTPLVVLADR